ncbi:MAG: hypothetical protein D6776_06545, partial [Planctomycetota bacterium]
LVQHHADHRADIYALGVVLYEMLTGELPVGHFDPPSRKIQLEVSLDDVILRVLAKDPERRYQHASDVGEEIRRRVSGARDAADGSRAVASSDLGRRLGRLLLRGFGIALLLAGLFVSVCLVVWTATPLSGDPGLAETVAWLAGFGFPLSYLLPAGLGLLPPLSWPRRWGSLDDPDAGPSWGRWVLFALLAWFLLPWPLDRVLLGAQAVLAFAVWSRSPSLFREQTQPPLRAAAPSPAATAPGAAAVQPAPRPAPAAAAASQPASKEEPAVRIDLPSSSPAATIPVAAAVPQRTRLSWMALLGLLASLAAMLVAGGLVAGEAWLSRGDGAILDALAQRAPEGIVEFVRGADPVALYTASFLAFWIGLAALAALVLWNLLALAHASPSRGRHGRGMASLATVLSIAAALGWLALSDNPAAHAIARAPEFETLPSAQLAWEQIPRDRLTGVVAANVLGDRPGDDAATATLARAALSREPLFPASTRLAAVAALQKQLDRLSTLPPERRKVEAAAIRRVLREVAQTDPAASIRRVAQHTCVWWE